MADQFDRAQELEAIALSDALSEQSRKAASSTRLEPTGFCLNPACDEPFAEVARLFCNPACEHEHRRRCK